MNVLHIGTSFTRGGAAYSLRAIHNALKAAGHESHVLVRDEAKDVNDVEALRPMRLWERIPYHGLNLLGLNYAGIPTTGAIARHPWFQAADVIHYHNLHGGFFNYLALPKLTGLKPSVWTLRDMWALTGHCAYSLECERWRTGCGRCPHPDIYPAIRRDATRWEWKLKQRAYRRSRMLITTPSKWLATLTQHSILGCRPVRHIDNAVDTDVFRPRDKVQLRHELGWPVDAIVLLFAADALKNAYKDYGLLQKVVAGLSLDRKQRIALAIMGKGDPANFQNLRSLALGYCDDDERKACYYAAADILLFPTKADNQPRVLIEAMACGCPAVATNVGGVPELVVPDETGILVQSGDATGMLKGIEELMDDPAKRIRMGENGRRVAVERHGLQRHLIEMLSAYDEAIRIWREAD